MKRFYIFLFSICCICHLSAQRFDWRHTFASQSIWVVKAAEGLQPTPDGGYIMGIYAGTLSVNAYPPSPISLPLCSNYGCLALAKFDSSGTLQKFRNSGDLVYDTPRGTFKTDKSGNSYMLVYDRDLATNKINRFVKLNANLDTVWTRYIVESGAHTILFDKNDNPLLMTSRPKLGMSGFEVMTIDRFNASTGNINWSQTMEIQGSFYQMRGSGINASGDICFFLDAGGDLKFPAFPSFATNDYFGNGAFVQLDGNTGQPKLLKRASTFIGAQADFRDFAIMKNGNFLFTGRSTDTIKRPVQQSDDSRFVFLTEFTPTFQLVKTTYAHVGDSYSGFNFADLSISDDGSIFISGNINEIDASVGTIGGDTVTFDIEQKHYMIAKLSPSHKLQWFRYWGAFEDWTPPIGGDGATVKNIVVHPGNRVGTLSIVPGSYFVIDSDTTREVVNTHQDGGLSAALIEFEDGWNVLSGASWYDYNKNGKKDNDEVPCAFCPIFDAQQKIIAFTDYRGIVQLNTKSLIGKVTIGAIKTGYKMNQSNYNIDFQKSPYIGDLKIPLVPEFDFHDLSIEATSILPARPGFAMEYSVIAKNNSTYPETVKVTVAIPSTNGLNSDPSNLHASYPDSLVWQLTLPPGKEQKLAVYGILQQNLSLGTEHICQFRISGDSQDQNLQDNFIETRQIVTGSYDPNDKQAKPDGQVSVALLPNIQNKPIEYLIRFQNTGTDTAFTVVVADTLHPLLDLSRIRILDASHPMRVESPSSRVLNFVFPNILLPDSTTNESESHGFVKYELGLQPLALGNEITNRAAIYFDFNSPVITNTTKLNVVQTIAAHETPAFDQCILQPNPVSTYTKITLPDHFTSEASYQLWNQLGQLISTSRLNSSGSVDLTYLQSGIYWLQILKGELVVCVNKLVVAPR
jgi:Secretion system C-terminal sorting domain